MYKFIFILYFAMLQYTEKQKMLSREEGSTIQWKTKKENVKQGISGISSCLAGWSTNLFVS